VKSTQGERRAIIIFRAQFHHHISSSLSANMDDLTDELCRAVVLNLFNLTATNRNQNLLIFHRRIVKVVTKKSLAAHLEGSHGTLVCRDTPVEKH